MQKNKNIEEKVEEKVEEKAEDNGKEKIEEIIRRISEDDPTLTYVDLAYSNTTKHDRRRSNDPGWISEEVCMELCLALANNVHVKFLNLSNNHLNTNCYEIISEMLLRNKSLCGLNLQNTVASDGSGPSLKYDAQRSLLLAIQNNNQLIDLTLEGIQFDEDFFYKILKRDNLSLSLTYCCDFNGKNMQFISNWMQKNQVNYRLFSINHNTDTEENSSRSNRYNEKPKPLGQDVKFFYDFALALENNIKLQTLKLEKIRLSAANCVALTHAAKKSKTLSRISVKGNNIDPARVDKLNQTLFEKHWPQPDFFTLLLILTSSVGDGSNPLPAELWLHVLNFIDSDMTDQKKECGKFLLSVPRSHLKQVMMEGSPDNPLILETTSPEGRKIFSFFSPQTEQKEKLKDVRSHDFKCGA